MKKLILFTTFFYICVLFLYSHPEFRIDKPFFNFGKVDEGTTVKSDVVIKNTGDETLVVNIKTSCDCLTVSKNKLMIKPSQQTVVKIKFDTKGFSGNTVHYIFFHTNDPEVKYIRWIVEGEVVKKNVAEKPEQLVSTKQTINGQAEQEIVVKMFFTSGCYICKKIKNKYVPEIEKKLGVKIKVEEYPLELAKNYELLIFYENQLQDFNNKLPAIVVGDKILAGQKEIKKKLETEILKIVNTESSTAKLENKNVQTVLSRLEMLHTVTIIFAGIVDGLNPCAFATVIFLIAYMSMIAKRLTHEVFITGIFFIIGVFITYLCIGFLLKNLFVLNVKNLLGKILYIILGVATLVAAGLSFADVVAIKKIEAGQQAKVYLQLPYSFRMKIYDIVSSIKYKNLIIIGFFLGITVSLVEFFCTGQIYLPTIMYMLAYTQLKVKAFFYLVLYCFMFVLPLIVVFVSLMFGLKSEVLENIGRKYVKTVKFVTGVVFLILSLWMFSIII